MSSLAGRRHRPTAVTDRGRLAVDLARVVRGEVRFDGGSQALYANDASVYHLLAAALSAHRSAAFDVHVLAGFRLWCRGGGRVRLCRRRGW
jgi:hypothetical protein